MDVLGARLRQELSGQPSAIDHQDSGIRVTLPEGADQARALDTIGRLLDEFGASLVTVIAHGHGMDASDTSSEGTEDDAMAAGRRLENAGSPPNAWSCASSAPPLRPGTSAARRSPRRSSC